MATIQGPLRPKTSRLQGETTSGKASLKRGKKVLRQRDAAQFGRGSSGHKGRGHDNRARLQDLVRGVKMAVAGVLQATAYEKILRSGIEGKLQQKADARYDAAARKLEDGRSLIAKSLRGVALPASIAARRRPESQAELLKRTNKAFAKATKKAGKRARSELRTRRYEEFGS